MKILRVINWSLCGVNAVAVVYLVCAGWTPLAYIPALGIACILLSELFSLFAEEAECVARIRKLAAEQDAATKKAIRDAFR